MKHREAVARHSVEAIRAGVLLFQSYGLGPDNHSHCFELMRHFEFPANRRILDIGSGTGFTAYVMGAMRGDLEFFNLNYIREQIIKSEHPSIVGDAHKLPFPNRAFGGAMLIFTLGHLRLLDTFREVYRVLNHSSALYIYDIYFPDSDHEEELDYVFWLPEEVCQVALQAGFEEVHFRLPTFYYTHNSRTLLGDGDFEKYFGRGRPILYQLTKAS